MGRVHRPTPGGRAGAGAESYLWVVTYDTDMTAVRLRDSARYGLRLYAYVLGITILGGAGVGLGAALAWPEVQAWRGPGVAEPAVGAGGGVLLFLGLSILATGYFGVAFKLLADGVAAGSSTTVGGEPGATQEAEPATADPNIGAEPEPEPARESTDDAASEEPTGAAVGSMAGEAAGDETTTAPADPPEPSPEEIAFGNTAGEEAEAAAEPDPAYEDTRSASSSDAVANQNADADPLADPSDDK